MVESVIRFLITAAVIVALVWLGLWVLATIGLVIPSQVVTIIWVIAVLVILLAAWRAFGANLRI